MKLKILKVKKNGDPRGWLAEVFRSDKIGSFKQVYFCTIAPGEIRANHYHKKKSEWICALKGKAEIKLNNKIVKVSGENLRLIKIDPFIFHTITNTGKENLYLAVASTKLYNKKNPDTYNHERKGKK